MKQEKERYKNTLLNIVQKCNKDNNNTQRVLAKIKVDMDMLKIHDQQFDKVQNQLKDLENVEGQLLPKIYDYKEIADKEDEQEAREVTMDFKRERMDPRRPIIQWERSVNTKKRNELAKKTRMINKGKDAGI